MQCARLDRPLPLTSPLHQTPYALHRFVCFSSSFVANNQFHDRLGYVRTCNPAALGVKCHAMVNAQSCELSCRLNSACDCIHILTSLVEVMGARAGLDQVEAKRMVLAVDELFANISEHGYGREIGTIEMRGVLAPEQLRFEIRDYAKPVVCKEALKGRDVCDIRPGGLGLHLIDSVMDEFRHEALGDGNRWILIRYLPVRRTVEEGADAP